MNSYIGNPAQLLDVKRFELSEGKAGGVACIQVENSRGLSAVIIQDRCMDLGGLRYQGVNYAYRTPGGIVAPEYYYGGEDSFFRSFGAGMMATCGLDNTGSGCIADGREYYRHGLIGNIPAENVSVLRDGDGETVTVTGEVHESCFMQENLILKREYEFRDSSPAFTIRDRIRNRGYHSTPFVVMYHFNLGYPLLSESTEVEIPARAVWPRSGSIEEMKDYGLISPPDQDWSPRAFFHDLGTEDEKQVEVRVYNAKLRKGLKLCFDSRALPKLVQWKLFRPGEYVMGIEPCTAFPYGRERLLREGIMPVLEPGEEREIKILVCPFEG